MRSNRLVIGLLGAALAALAANAQAETILVNSFDDRPDADLGDGVCDADLETPGLQCTLRAAVMHANAVQGEDTIIVPAGTYKLTVKGAEERDALTGDLDLNDDVFISGAGATTTIIDCKKAKDRAFDVPFGVTARIAGLTITKGKAPAGESGGGIRSSGFTTVEDCIVSKCKAGDDAGGIDIQAGTGEIRRVWIDRCSAKDDGGGIDVDGGTLSIDGCAITKCKAKSEGGGVENSGELVSIVNSTISGNKAKKAGGGISLEDAGTLDLLNCTVAFNKSKIGGGITVGDEDFGPNTCTVRNSIFAGNKKLNSDRVLTSLGGNLDSGSTCGFETSDTNPLLGKLALNGGISPTHALADGSPAAARGTAGCPESDQRGVSRGDPCDSGAFEIARVVK